MKADFIDSLADTITKKGGRYILQACWNFLLTLVRPTATLTEAVFRNDLGERYFNETSFVIGVGLLFVGGFFSVHMPTFKVWETTIPLIRLGDPLTFIVLFCIGVPFGLAYARHVREIRRRYREGTRWHSYCSGTPAKHEGFYVVLFAVLLFVLGLYGITDPNHVWYDPDGRTFHIILRCNTAGVGYAAVLKVIEDKHGDTYTDIVTVPSGESLVFMPLPGGHNKFYMLYDRATKHYWLASTQAYDSMCMLARMPDLRFNLPNNERHRLVLHFSKNCIDWIFAGAISIGKNELHARNYPAMELDGEDLLVIVRAGNDDAKDSQYTNLITLNRIRHFRELIY